MCVDEDKRKRLTLKLKECIERNTMDPGETSSMAGQFTWTTTTAANKVGRAFVKPLHAQAHRPLPGNVCSPALQFSMAWWLDYLTESPSFCRSLARWDRADHFVAWSDASGEHRILAALIRNPAGRFWWTRMRVPDEI